MHPKIDITENITAITMLMRIETKRSLGSVGSFPALRINATTGKTKSKGVKPIAPQIETKGLLDRYMHIQLAICSYLLQLAPICFHLLTVRQICSNLFEFVLSTVVCPD